MISRCKGCGRFKIRDRFSFCSDCQDINDEEIMQRDRDRASAWAGQMLTRAPLILDTETTGLNGYLVQISVIDCGGDVLLDSLVNPHAEIEDGALRVHGLTSAALRGAPTYRQIHPLVDTVLRGRTVLVYNLEFDVRILRNELRRAGQVDGVLFGAEWHDLMMPYSKFVGNRRGNGYRWQRLPGGDHTALGDCRAALDVLRRMALP